MVEREKSSIPYLNDLEGVELENKEIISKQKGLVDSLKRMDTPFSLIALRFKTELDDVDREISKDNIFFSEYEDFPLFNKVKSLSKTSNSFITIKDEETTYLASLLMDLLKFVDKRTTKMKKRLENKNGKTKR